MPNLWESLATLWGNDVPEEVLSEKEPPMRTAECCAFMPRCHVGVRKGHVVSTHEEGVVLFVHFDDGEYAALNVDEVEFEFAKEAASGR